MLFFKACPRCKGDMHDNRDLYGNYKECLQCGYMVDLDKANGLISVPVTGRKKKIA